MAYSVTHIILTIVLLDIFRHYVFGKRKFPRYLLVVGGIAGLAPDIDVPLSWLINLFSSTSVNLHGTFTHSLIFPLIFLIVGAILHKQNQMKWAKIFYVIAAGWTFHLFLDCLYGGYKTFLWPLSIGTGFCPQWGISNLAQSIDAIILVVWLIHEEVHKRIKDYI
jgi:membrane-bound metal-dependent hydrolase YbcI (DUF457 family)